MSREVRARRADDVLEMQRAARRGGTPQLLRWLTARSGADVLLVDGADSAASPCLSALPALQRDLVLRAVREVAARGLRSVVLDHEGLTCLVLPLDGPPGVPAPLLAAVACRPAPPELAYLLADATYALGLSRTAEDTHGLRQRLATAEARNREAVLHLLMNGHTAVARQIAGALLPALPEHVRVYVIEGPPAARERVAQEVAEADTDAWIVPCPVYSGHMLVLAPARPESPCDACPPWLSCPTVAEDCRVGESDDVPLQDTATGYAQAFHALAAARTHRRPHSSFAAGPDLALTIGLPAATAWANALLLPLHRHTPRRAQDPDRAELLATAAAWLSFAARATAHLKIHRNTLTARLSYIQALLGLDLDRLCDQAALSLALRVAAEPADLTGSAEAEAEAAGIAGPGPRAAAPTLDSLLLSPGVEAWAQAQFRPTRTAVQQLPPDLADTLSTWLRHDAHISSAAAALSLSPSAVRKRLTRIEALLERSLLRPPSAVHDLWLAQRALGLGAPCAGKPGSGPAGPGGAAAARLSICSPRL
ncbi:helix-turn-helix domain-containing protein [Streptomyces sp. NPDC101206]|uniref:helix-turn-helix domain-containing protein n=1 Tax=Streptomyces sp. NPDC101206 TaxID=3366128 RepID=UPI0037F1C55F